MNIIVIGTGYVGLVTGACFAEMGHHVTCVDIDQAKIDKLKQGTMPIYEPNLETIVKNNQLHGLLNFSNSINNQEFNTKVYFISVGTPSDIDGSADLQYVLNVAHDIGRNLNDYAVIVNKSTVPVGTADLIRNAINEELEKRNINIEFDLVSNPEFLREGAAIEDFMHPNRIIIGMDSIKAKEIIEELYAHFTRNQERIIFMGIRDAEMTKYVSNSFLATKISFMNEVANICEELGADVDNVRIGIGSDKRIGYEFINPGCGYGGSCFPKDVKALINLAEKNGIDPKILTAVEKRNDEQKHVLSKKLISKFGENLKGLTIGLWGISFKPDTDDIREASSIVFLKDVISKGATVKAYDPVAMKIAKLELPKEWFDDGLLQLVNRQEHAFQNADALVLVTEWKHFLNPNFDEIKKLMKGNLIIDGRNQYNPDLLRKMGFEYMGIGR